MIVSTQSLVNRGGSGQFVGANGAGVRIVTDMISRVGRMLAQRILERAYRRAEMKLMGFDDRMLSDIGLPRGPLMTPRAGLASPVARTLTRVHSSVGVGAGFSRPPVAAVAPPILRGRGMERGCHRRFPER